jgi:hypothetical protein
VEFFCNTELILAAAGPPAAAQQDILRDL